MFRFFFDVGIPSNIIRTESNRIVTRIAIQIKTIHIARIYALYIIRRNKPSPLGVVVSSIKIIQFCFSVVVIASIGLYACYVSNIIITVNEGFVKCLIIFASGMSENNKKR